MNRPNDPELRHQLRESRECPLFDGSCPDVGAGALPPSVKGSSRETAHARKTDGPNSRAAARSVVNLGRVRDAILGVLKLYGPQTDEGIIAALRDKKYSPSGIRSRRAELVKLGFVIESGAGTTVSGRRCSKWRIK